MTDDNGARIAFWRSVCGCTPGGWSALAAIVYCAVATPFSADGPWLRFAASVGIVVAAAVLAKLAALATARIAIAVLEG